MEKESLATTGRKKPYVSIRYSIDTLITVLWILLAIQTRKQNGSGSVINRRIDFRRGKTMAEQSLFQRRGESNVNCTALHDAELFHQRTRNYILAGIIVTEAVLSRSSRLLQWPINRETVTSDWFFPVLEEIDNFNVSRRISMNPGLPYSRTVRLTKNEFVWNLVKSQKKAAKSRRRDAKKNGKGEFDNTVIPMASSNRRGINSIISASRTAIILTISHGRDTKRDRSLKDQSIALTRNDRPKKTASIPRYCDKGRTDGNNLPVWPSHFFSRGKQKNPRKSGFNGNNHNRLSKQTISDPLDVVDRQGNRITSIERN